MSLVMAFATNDFVVMSGDLRRTGVNDETKKYDDTLKVFGLNKHLLMGLTGDVDVLLKISAMVNEKIGEYTTAEAAIKLIRKYIKEIANEDTQQTVIIAGKSDSGKLGIFNISHRNKFKIEKEIVPKNQVRWKYSYSIEDPKSIIEREFERLEEYTINSFADLAKKVNENVSERDPFISKECSVLGIRM